MSQSGILNNAIIPPGAAVQTLTGNDLIAVGPNGLNNINVVGAGAVTVTGDAGTNTLTITVTGGGLTWIEVAIPTVMAVNTGYIANSAGVLAFTLPAVFAQGSIIEAAYKGVGGWSITTAAGDTITYGNAAVGTVLSSIAAGDCVRLLAITANSAWEVLSGQGNLNIV